MDKSGDSHLMGLGEKIASHMYTYNYTDSILYEDDHPESTK